MIKYIKVGADAIKKDTYKSNVSGCIIAGNVTMDKAFEENGVKNGFRSIILKRGLFNRGYARELVTNRLFVISEFSMLNGVHMCTPEITIDGDMDYSCEWIRDGVDIISKKDAEEFYDEICMNGNMEKYEDAVMSFFDLEGIPEYSKLVAEVKAKN